jgi:hypothetical protein
LAASAAGFYQHLEDYMTHQITDMLRSPQPGASVRPEDAMLARDAEIAGEL